MQKIKVKFKNREGRLCVKQTLQSIFRRGLPYLLHTKISSHEHHSTFIYYHVYSLAYRFVWHVQESGHYAMESFGTAIQYLVHG